MAAFVNKDAGTHAAIIAGHSRQMDDAANRGLRTVRSVAGAHRHTGAYIDKLSVITAPGISGNGRRVSDRLIVSDDPGSPAIEYGHMVRHKHARRVSWVPGQHIMGRALKMMS